MPASSLTQMTVVRSRRESQPKQVGEKDWNPGRVGTLQTRFHHEFAFGG